MPCPSWRPMPKYAEDPSHPAYAAGAIKRAHHRTLMRLRWRNKEARDRDREAKRLPHDWHEWMLCDAKDGYKTAGCTCDTWHAAEARQPTRPSEIIRQDRLLRAKLSRELTYSFKARQLAEANGEVLVGRGVGAVDTITPATAVWVKSIDTGAHRLSIPLRQIKGHGPLHGHQSTRSQRHASSRLRASARRVEAVRRPGRGERGPIRRRATTFRERLLGLAPWLGQGRCHLPALQSAGSAEG